MTLDEEDEDSDVAVDAEGMRFIAETNLASSMGGLFYIELDERGMLKVTAPNTDDSGNKKSFTRRLR